MFKFAASPLLLSCALFSLSLQMNSVVDAIDDFVRTASAGDSQVQLHEALHMLSLAKDELLRRQDEIVRAVCFGQKLLLQLQDPQRANKESSANCTNAGEHILEDDSRQVSLEMAKLQQKYQQLQRELKTTDIQMASVVEANEALKAQLDAERRRLEVETRRCERLTAKLQEMEEDNREMQTRITEADCAAQHYRGLSRRLSEHLEQQNRLAGGLSDKLESSPLRSPATPITPLFRSPFANDASPRVRFQSSKIEGEVDNSLATSFGMSSPTTSTPEKSCIGSPIIDMPEDRVRILRTSSLASSPATNAQEDALRFRMELARTAMHLKLRLDLPQSERLTEFTADAAPSEAIESDAGKLSAETTSDSGVSSPWLSDASPRSGVINPAFTDGDAKSFPSPTASDCELIGAWSVDASDAPPGIVLGGPEDGVPKRSLASSMEAADLYAAKERAAATPRDWVVVDASGDHNKRTPRGSELMSCNAYTPRGCLYTPRGAELMSCNTYTPRTPRDWVMVIECSPQQTPRVSEWMAVN